MLGKIGLKGCKEWLNEFVIWKKIRRNAIARMNLAHERASVVSVSNITGGCENYPPISSQTMSSVPMIAHLNDLLGATNSSDAES